MRLQDLKSGHRFPDGSLSFTVEEATAYAAATGDTSARPDEQVPPMAVVAAGLSRLIKELELADGTLEVVHASQEVSFARPVAPGERIATRAILKSNASRRGSIFATVDMAFTGEDGSDVATATSLIIVGES